MLAKQFSKHPEIFSLADAPLKEVFNQMIALGCDCMPVVESTAHKNIIGIITEHGICQKIINDGVNPQRISAGRIMSGNFTTVSAEATAEECLELFKITGAKKLFVVDEIGSFMGVLTERDIVIEKPVLNLETVIQDFSMSKSLPTEIHLAC